MAMVGDFWAKEGHYPVWRRALERLGSTRANTGMLNLLDLQRYPATLLLYALGLGAIEAGRLQFLEHLFAIKLPYNWRFYNKAPREMLAVQLLPPFCMFYDGGQVMKILEGMNERYVPLNDWIAEVLRPYAQHIIPDNSRYTLTFDELEMLMALSSLAHDNMRVVAGAFCYREDNRIRIVEKIEESLSTLGDSSPLVICKIFGKTAEQCKETLGALKQHLLDFRYQ